MHRQQMQVHGGRAADPGEFPDYEGPEEGQLPEDWADRLADHPMIRTVEATEQEPSEGVVQ